ncbi:hypothetical protein WR25_06706 isoform B [Diploscapter pachys]|nr:hypothetical protein WR25_06706 isoform B [Diploscapter pachys]
MMEYRDIRGLCGGKKEYDSYREKVDEALKQVQEAEGDLCGQLKDIQPVKFQNEHESDQQNTRHSKSITSPAIVALEHDEKTHDKSPPKAGKLKAFETMKLELNGRMAHVGNCQQEIHSIRVAPNLMESGEEVIAVCCNPNFMTANFSTPQGKTQVQFWLNGGKNKNSQLRPWFTLHFEHYVIKCEWLNRKNAQSDSKLIGHLALVVYDSIYIYRIDSDSAAIPTKPTNAKIFDEKPALILKNIAPVEEKLEVLDEDEEDEEEKENEMEDGNEESNDVADVVDGRQSREGGEEEDGFGVPLTSLSWSPENGGKLIASLSADGWILIWDLATYPPTQKRLRCSVHQEYPVTDIALLTDNKVAVCVRERGIFLLDLESGGMHDETAICQEYYNRMRPAVGILDGFFAFQGEPATHASRYFGAGCFVDMRGKETDTYSTVQLLNSHPVMCGEFAFSPQDGAIISCGADGTILATYNGYVVPGKGNDMTMLSRQEYLLRLRRHKKTITKAVEKKDLEMMFNTDEEVMENMWMTADLTPEVPAQTNQRQFDTKMTCFDRRIDALMSVEVGRAEMAVGCEKMQSPSRTSPSKQRKRAESSAVAETKDKDGAVNVVYAGGIAGCLFAIPYTPSWIAGSSYVETLEIKAKSAKKALKGRIKNESESDEEESSEESEESEENEESEDEEMEEEVKPSLKRTRGRPKKR